MKTISNLRLGWGIHSGEVLNGWRNVVTIHLDYSRIASFRMCAPSFELRNTLRDNLSDCVSQFIGCFARVV